MRRCCNWEATSCARLDWLTPPIHEACADDHCCQFQQRFVDIQPSFKADSQLAKACKPAVRPLHHPPVFAQPLAALNASSGNSANDAPLPQVGSASLEVVAFVGVQLCRSSTGTSWQASNRRNRVHAPLEHLGVVPVRAADQDHQRDASGIYDDVPLGAELASVRGVWARFLAPRGLGTEEPSMLARLQSIWSCSRKRVSMACCSCSQAPAAFQLRRRRQQVMPLPYPRDWGRSSHGMPVCSTNKMPLRAASSLTTRLHAPPFAEGMRGCSCRHSSLLTGRRAMRTARITAPRGPVTKWC